MPEKKDYGHVITIAQKGAEKYVYAIIKSLQPQNYEKYGNIKVQVMDSNLPLAEYVLTLFKNIWCEETDRERKTVPIQKDDGESYPLDVIEITLQKHPKLRR